MRERAAGREGGRGGLRGRRPEPAGRRGRGPARGGGRRGALRSAGRRGRPRAAARMAAQAADRAAASDVEVRQQRRWPQRGRRRLQPVDFQRGLTAGPAPPPRGVRRDRGGHGHGAGRRPGADGPLARRLPGRASAAAGGRGDARNTFGGKGSQRRFANHADPDARPRRGAQGRVGPHRRAVGGRPDPGGRLPAGRGGGPNPRLRRADPVGGDRSPRSTTSVCRRSRGRCAGSSTKSIGWDPTWYSAWCRAAPSARSAKLLAAQGFPVPRRVHCGRRSADPAARPRCRSRRWPRRCRRTSWRTP